MPCWAKAIAVASTGPIQIGRYLSPSVSLSRTMGWFVGISTRTPTTSIFLTAAPSWPLSGTVLSRTLLKGIPLSKYTRHGSGHARALCSADGTPALRPGETGIRQGHLDQRRVHGEHQRGDLPGGRGCPVPRPGAALPQDRRHDLLDQGGFPLHRGPQHPQVPRLDPVPAQRHDRLDGLDGLRRILPARPADQAKLLQIRQFPLVDAGRVEHFPPGHRPGGGPVGLQLVLDHPQRQVKVALGGEDVPEPLHVRRAELAVAGGRAGRLDQPFRLQETDLGDADIRELGAELGKHLADAKVCPGWLSTHAPTCAPPPRSAWDRLPARKVSRNLPTWTSSPSFRLVSSIRSRFT